MDNKKRVVIQSIATLLQNINLKGFFSGQIYQGAGKTVCVPGLNCYSCPGAIGSCPIGSLQNALSSFHFKFPYYVLGLLIFFGALLGRIVCGFLCPFGFFQDLLHKIPFPKKIRTFKGDHLLRNVKYLILLLLVVIFPVCVKLTPFFCKYLCPSGTISGVLLSLSDHSLFALFGKLFTWKVIVLLAIILLSLMIYRPFCKYLCPLGAFYAPFNKVSFVHMEVDTDACIHCRKCAASCQMGVDPSKDPNSSECIRCGSCINACSAHALSYKTLLSGLPDRTP